MRSLPGFVNTLLTNASALYTRGMEELLQRRLFSCRALIPARFLLSLFPLFFIGIQDCSVVFVLYSTVGITKHDTE